MILQDCTGIPQQGQNWKPDLLSVVQLLHQCLSFIGFICITHKKNQVAFPQHSVLTLGFFFRLLFLIQMEEENVLQ